MDKHFWRVAAGAILLAVATISAAADAPKLEDILNKLPPSTEKTGGINSMRYEALSSAARSYGMRAGLAYGHSQNMKRLESLSVYMDQTYPFQALMMEGNVVPPVISEVVEVFEQTSSNTLRLADRERTIIAQPRFSYAAPSWRDYYVHEFGFHEDAVAGVSPKDDEETALWKTSVKEGYAAGLQQANAIFERDTARLARDINGMRLYHQLLKAGKVTKPYVSVVHMGVTGDKNSVMKEGESLLKISAVPEFVMDPKLWDTPLPSSIQKRLEILVDPVAGAKLAERIGVAKETHSLDTKRSLPAAIGSARNDRTAEK